MRLLSFLFGILLSLVSLTAIASAQEATLQQLTVQPEFLPRGCQLAPQGGLPFSPRDSNPVVTTRSEDFQVLSGFVMGAAGAMGDLELQTNGTSEGQARLEAWSANQATKIAAAYTAMYVNEDRKTRGVYALLFKEPIDRTEMRARRTARDSVIVKGSLLIFAFANRGSPVSGNTDSLACFDAIRGRLDTLPPFENAYQTLGMTLFGLGRTDEAVEAFQAGVQRDPNDATSHLFLGIAFHVLERLDEAGEILRRAVRLAPEDSRIPLRLGVVLRDQKKYDEAVVAFREAARLQPDNATVYMELAGALNNQQKFSEAIPAFRELLRLRPDHAWGHNNLGVALRTQGLLDDAVEAHRTAIRLNPSGPSAYSNLGEALHAQGRFTEAEDAFARGRELESRRR